jgi:Mrp family chromosome partitioning ATPase/capsular polysaccharide biosynthesis protein
MNDDSVQYDQRRLMRLVSRHVSLLALCVLVGLAVALARLVLQGPTYSASSEILVGAPVTLTSLTTNSDTNRDQARLVDSQLRRMESDRVGTAVEQKLPAKHARYGASFASGSTTNVVTVTVKSPNKGLARDVANAYGVAYVEQLQADNDAVIAATEKQLGASIAAINEQLTKLEKTLSSADSDSLARVQAIVTPTRSALLDQRTALQKQLDQVALQKSVASSGGARVIQAAGNGTTSMLAIASPVVLGALLGLLVGLALVWLRELRSGRVVDETDLEYAGLEARSVWSLPVRLPAKPSTSAVRPLSRAEVASLRALAATMWPLRGSGEHVQVCLMAAIEPDRQAAAALAARLAGQLSDMQRDVVVVDADPSSTELARHIPEAGGAGLAEVLRDEKRLDEVLVRHQGGRMLVLGSGADASGAQLGSVAFGALLRQLAERADVVIVIGAPLVGASESLLVAPQVDRVVALARRGRTRRRTVSRFVAQLPGDLPQLAALRHPDVVVHGEARPWWRLRMPTAPARKPATHVSTATASHEAATAEQTSAPEHADAKSRLGKAVTGKVAGGKLPTVRPSGSSPGVPASAD